MGIVERWNKFAKKKIYINDGWELPAGRLAYMIILNVFIQTMMLLSLAPLSSTWYLWIDMAASFRSKQKGNGD